MSECRRYSRLLLWGLCVQRPVFGLPVTVDAGYDDVSSTCLMPCYVDGSIAEY